MEFLCTLIDKFLPRSPVIEFLAQSPLEKREEVRIFSSGKDEIRFEKYVK